MNKKNKLMKPYQKTFLFILLFLTACSAPVPNVTDTPTVFVTITTIPILSSTLTPSITPTFENVETLRAVRQATRRAGATSTKAVRNLTATVVALTPSSTPSVTPIPTKTATNTAVSTKTLTPTPQPLQHTPTSTTVFEPQSGLESLPDIGTPFTQSDEIITEPNLSRLTELARWGKGVILDVIFSPNGERLGVAAATGIYLYDTTTWEEVLEINYPDMVTSLAFSSDGKQLAVGFYSGFVQIIDIDANKTIHVIETDYSPSQLEYLDNDSYLLSTSNYSYRPILWSFKSNDLVDLKDLLGEEAEFVVPSVKGETFATVINTELRLWDLETEGFSHSYPTDLDAYEINGVAKANEYYAIGLWHGGLEFRELDTGELLWEASAWCEKCFSPFDLEDHSPKCDYGHYDVQPPDFINIQFSPDERYLITDFLGRIQWRDTSTGKVVRQYEARTDVAFSAETDMMAWATSDGVIKVERISDGQEIIHLEDYFTPGVQYAEFAPNGKQVLIKDWHTFRFRMANDGRLFRSLVANDLDIAPDGSLIALGHQDGLVEIKRNSDLSLITAYQREANPVTQVEFSSKGNWFFSVHDCVVYAADTQNWSNQYAIIGSYGPASISTTPDEERLLFEQNGLDLYHLSDGQWVENRNSRVDIEKNEVSYTLNAKALLKADAIGGAEFNVSGDWDLLGNGAFSPDGHLFVTIDYWEGKIYFWRTSDGG